MRGAPDHAGPAVSLIEDALFRDLVGGHVSQRCGEHEDHFMLHSPVRLEDVLQDAQQPEIGQVLADLLLELAVHRPSAASLT